MKFVKIKPLEVKAARIRMGYSQKYMAEKLGITFVTYQKKESGANNFTDGEKFQVAKILKLSREQADDYLFGGNFTALSQSKFFSP